MRQSANSDGRLVSSMQLELATEFQQCLPQVCCRFARTAAHVVQSETWEKFNIEAEGLTNASEAERRRQL
jgi:secreted trypsin-like serine protease